MAKKTKSTDVNVTAFAILQAATGGLAGHESPKPIKKKGKPAKNPAAVALGRLGGLKGGKARAAMLSPMQRRHIAQKAARIRWKKGA
jgi:hypothetical protein